MQNEGSLPMKFISIGYGSREGYDRADIAALDAAHANDDRLRRAGALMGIAGYHASSPGDRNWEDNRERIGYQKTGAQMKYLP
jgi:hypothetical protein